MMQDVKTKLLSNDYVDLFIAYNGDEKLLNQFPDAAVQIMDLRYAIAYSPSNILNKDFINQYGYAPLPRCYGLTSSLSLNASGVSKLRNLPNFNLKGKGVIMAIIDTGIDYTNPIFKREDGSSKILSIWDQTINSDHQESDNITFGTEYQSEQINIALNSEKPLEVVPSVDEIGHGTMLAGLMVGSPDSKNNFSGVVPDADIIVVKLKQAKQSLRNFFLLPNNIPCYQENDIMWALHYVMNTTLKLKRPCSICLGLGSSQGSHQGRGPLNELLDVYSDFQGYTISISAGNEGDKRRHYYDEIDPTIGKSSVEFNVGENEVGFFMELWGTTPNTFSIDILAPSGEYVPRIAESLRTNREISFIFQSTEISVNYKIAESSAGAQLILLRFRNPISGVWKLQVYSHGDLPGIYHIWLPMDGFISENTYFINPNRFITITSPGDTSTPITMTSYNPKNRSLFEQASKGYTGNDFPKPDLAAPGVELIVPTLSKGFGVASGTGLAAAHTAGIAAIMLEWGIINGFYPLMNSTVVKKYLIRGADRSQYLQYPNQDWGYGIINVYNVFNVLKSDFPRST